MALSATSVTCVGRAGQAHTLAVSRRDLAIGANSGSPVAGVPPSAGAARHL